MAESQSNNATVDTQDDVEYRPIAGYPGYRVGDDGSVWGCLKRGNPNREDGSVRTCYVMSEEWKKLKLSKNRTGYPRAAMFCNGVQKRIMVHLLVLEAFVGPRPAGMLGCHANDIKSDNRLENLRWDTPSENWSDRKKNGRIGQKLGHENCRAKLSEQDVIQIRRRRANGERCIDIARDFVVTATTITEVCLRQTYTNIP